MERKAGNTAVVTAEEVTTALSREGAATTTATEEKALRMRYGARVDTRAPLPKAAGDNEELSDELLLIEMHLLRALKHRKAMAQKAAAPAARNVTKDKIVSKLRTKKKS
ncbi:MAG: hypothetical protein JNG84_13545 [Archangium sp.]|nr:hypothetical protein [Archangium sp.]